MIRSLGQSPDSPAWIYFIIWPKYRKDRTFVSGSFIGQVILSDQRLQRLLAAVVALRFVWVALSDGDSILKE